MQTPYNAAVPQTLPSLSPDQERSLLNSIFDSSLSLPDLAKSLNFTLLDLLELIASPPIQAKLIALEQSAAHAVRAAASTHLHDLLDSLLTILESHDTDLKLLEGRTDPDALTQRRRERVQLRITATLLYRITRFIPLSPDSLLIQRTTTAGDQAAPGTPQNGFSPRQVPFGGVGGTPFQSDVFQTPDPRPAQPRPIATSPAPAHTTNSPAAIATPTPALKAAAPAAHCSNSPAPSTPPRSKHQNGHSAGTLSPRIQTAPALEHCPSFRAGPSRASSLLNRAGAAVAGPAP